MIDIQDAENWPSALSNDLAVLSAAPEAQLESSMLSLWMASLVKCMLMVPKDPGNRVQYIFAVLSGVQANASRMIQKSEEDCA